jgi:hypothetical protein
MDASRRQSGLVSVDGSPRDAARVIAVAAILIAVAVVKPWGGSPPGPDRAPAVVAASPRADTPSNPAHAPPPDPSLGPDEIACLHGLELVSLVRLGDWNVREWLPIARTQATGPQDPRLTFAVLDGGPVRALGVCNEYGNPNDGPGQATSSHPVVVGAWRLSTKPQAAAIDLVELKPKDGRQADARLPHLYQPIAAERTRIWHAGRYALEIAMSYPPGPGDTMWVGLEVVDTKLASR